MSDFMILDFQLMIHSITILDRIISNGVSAIMGYPPTISTSQDYMHMETG
jgi:hypothetical protein